MAEIVSKSAPLYASDRMSFSVVRVRGASGAEQERGYIEHPGSVVILALTDDDRAVLIENHRWTVGRTLLELPAGTMAPTAAAPPPTAGAASPTTNTSPRPEPAVDAAARELREETGYSAEKLTAQLRFYAAPGSSTEQMSSFVATGLRHVGQQLEDDESIAVRLVPIDGLDALMRSGAIEDAKSIAVISRYLLDRARDRL